MVNLSASPDAHATFDLRKNTIREVNRFLHGMPAQVSHVCIKNPDGAHNIAVGIERAATVEICGHAGYYAGGMNHGAHILVRGNSGQGVAENMMSGRVEVSGFASACAGSSAHGGLLVIHGDGGLRCGISLKGGDIVVGGDVGGMSAFMAQAGRMVVCGNAGDGLGDSLYEAVIYVRGTIRSLGADAQIEPMSVADFDCVGLLLSNAAINVSPHEFKRVASARSLYHWNADANQEY